mmetsp:Transcript_41735/g.100126  ORF Transcript_41735/g.100126 Transcript_41735/m.100126 type:complete len:135 (-) Transcript_41735:21-425(-)
MAADQQPCLLAKSQIDRLLPSPPNIPLGKCTPHPRRWLDHEKRNTQNGNRCRACCATDFPWCTESSVQTCCTSQQGSGIDQEHTQKAPGLLDNPATNIAHQFSIDIRNKKPCTTRANAGSWRQDPHAQDTLSNP